MTAPQISLTILKKVAAHGPMGPVAHGAAREALPALVAIVEAAQFVLEYLDDETFSAFNGLCDEPVCDFNGCVHRRALRMALNRVDP